MSEQRRRAKRHEIAGDQRIDVNVFRNAKVADCKDNEPGVVAEIVDISLTGLKLESTTAFEFQEKIVISISRASTEEPILLPAQVRWVQPVSKGRKNSNAWAAGCLLEEALPRDYIDEISASGMLDRRASPRIQIDKNATARWEMSQADFEVQIKDVSTTGIGLVVPKDCEVGKRIRIEVDKGTEKQTSVTGKTVRQNPVDDGTFVGFEIATGSADALKEYAVEGVTEKPAARRSYQTLTFSGISLVIVMIVRQLFF